MSRPVFNETHPLGNIEALKDHHRHDHLRIGLLTS